ncbi:hypothetical protein BD779DRAFT_1125575 [Infundibulicybe gibba]|nr:hypothetical protein BD779DRAFT_1125575 [Infundibulicybe gibba]
MHDPGVRHIHMLVNSHVLPKKSALNDLIHEELKSAVYEVIQECLRFRILVIGKSGVGKSSLINAAFDVDLAHVSHDRAGVSSIHQEITSPKNKRFILHDSQGFAPGETENYNTVKNFILQRANMPDLSDRLHAIWLCLETPTTNNALLERGDLEFLNLPLGKVPVVVAFTKLDILVRRFEDKLYDEDTYDEATFDTLVWSHVEPELNRTCLIPLQRATCHLSAPLSSVMVSTQMPSGPAGDTLKKLMEVTTEHIHSSVYIIWALAQRVDVDMKIEASIRIGKHKYWRGLASGLFFNGKTLKSCLDVIHRDIIAIWNFCDDEEYLQSDEFKAMIVELVSDLAEPTKPQERSGTFESTASVNTAMSKRSISSVVIPLAQMPVTASVKFARWVYDLYCNAPHVIRCLMGYIVDLIIVMQSLFWMMKDRGEEKGETKNGEKKKEKGVSAMACPSDAS